MKFLILKKNDDWFDIGVKLFEEHNEVQEAIYSLLNYQEKKVNNIIRSREELASELLDLIQVCIGGLDKLEVEGLDIKKSISLHTDKLIKRGWSCKYKFKIRKCKW